MSISSETLKKLNALIAELSAPVIPVDVKSGWDSESKQAIKRYFSEVRRCYEAEHPLPSLGVIRGLDAWGISSGDLFDQCIYVTNKLRDESAS